MDITDQIDREKWKKFMKKQGKDEHGKPLEKISVTVTQTSSSSSSSDAPAAPPVAASTTVPLSARLPQSVTSHDSTQKGRSRYDVRIR